MAKAQFSQQKIMNSLNSMLFRFFIFAFFLNAFEIGWNVENLRGKKNSLFLKKMEKIVRRTTLLFVHR